MTLAAVKTWIVGETLTASDLNALNTNILNNPGSLITPITFNLTFTDATYDIGASGATRPRDLWLSRNASVGGTLAVTGVATLTGGLVLTSVAGTSHETGTTSTTLTADGGGSTSAAKTLTWQRFGNWVTLHIPAVTVTSGTGSIEIKSNTALAAAVRPTATQLACLPRIGNAAATTTPGLVILNTDGTVSLRRDPASTAFTNASACGPDVAFSVLYFIG